MNVSGKSGVLTREGKKESGKKNKNERMENEEERYKDMTRWKKRRELVESLLCEEGREEQRREATKKKETAQSTVEVGEIWEMVLHFVIDGAGSSGCKCSIG